MLTLLDQPRLISSERGPSPIVDPLTLEAVGPTGERIDLSPAQFAILFALAKRPWRGVLLWPDAVALVHGEDARREWHNYMKAMAALLRRLNYQLSYVGWGRASVRSVRGHGIRLYVAKEYLLGYTGDAIASVDAT